MSKIVQKYIINSINSSYLDAIKKHYYNNGFMNHSMEEIISTYEIYGKKIDFYFNFIKSPGDKGYNVGAYYFIRQINKKYKILITLRIFDDFNQRHFSELHLRIKACLVHEIEHHLQKLKAPNREHLPRKNFKNILEYVDAPSEIEACLKHLYFTHKKTGINFSKLLIEEAINVSDDEDLQDRFINNITKYLISRKDLNLFRNINF